MVKIRRLEGATKELWTSCLIDSPVAVVKELIDNSVDARASRITVEIDQQSGGMKWIQVTDDGEGIDRESIKMACLEHTTSKITSLEDITNCDTLGFRGDALFAIASLVKDNSLYFTSRHKSCPVGYFWEVGSDGSTTDRTLQKTASIIGTTVTVRDLFERYPVRKKLMMKTTKNNMSQILSLVKEYTLCYQDIRFEVKIVDSRFKTITSQVFIPHEGVSQIIGSRVFVENTFEIGSGISFNCLITEKDTPQSIRALAINNRPINLSLNTGKQIHRSIKTVLGEDHQRYSWFLNLTILDPSKVDVNIEPKKDDVIIKDFGKVLHLFEEKLKNIITEVYDNKHTPSSPSDDLTLVEVTASSKIFENLEQKENTTCTSFKELTNDSTIENEWSTSMHQRFSSRTNSSSGYMSDKWILEDEDLTLSKSIKVSNPFVLSKMAKKHKPIHLKNITNLNGKDIPPIFKENRAIISSRNTEICKTISAKSKLPYIQVFQGTEKLKDIHVTLTVREIPSISYISCLERDSHQNLKDLISSEIQDSDRVFLRKDTLTDWYILH